MPDLFPKPGNLPLEWRSGSTFRLVVELFTDEAQTIPKAVAGLTWRSECRRTEDVISDLLATIDVSPVAGDPAFPDGNALELYVGPLDVQKACLAAQATRRGFWSLKQIIGDDARPWLAGTVALIPDPTALA